MRKRTHPITTLIYGSIGYPCLHGFAIFHPEYISGLGKQHPVKQAAILTDEDGSAFVRDGGVYTIHVVTDLELLVLFYIYRINPIPNQNISEGTIHPLV